MAATTWVDVESGSDFPIHNLPYGVVSRPGSDRYVVVRIGNFVLPLEALAFGGFFDDIDGIEGLAGLTSSDPRSVFASGSLNAFMATGPHVWSAVRERLTRLLTEPAYRSDVEPLLVRIADVVVLLPIDVGDYVDFYSSLNHAQNVGAIFRPDSEPLTPNCRHLPIGYHGRAGTIVVSGTPITRPRGQRKSPERDAPTFGPTRRLDIEAEVGFVVGVPTELGHSVSTADFADHVFGVVLVNDWSARDIQAWEYVPLGPFLGKSFATSVSAWVVPLAALERARVPGPEQDPAVLPYLEDNAAWSMDLELEVRLNDDVISRPPFASMYWTPGQQLAHMTVNGASLRTGDLFASGTVSGPERDQRGSLLELSWGGREPFVTRGVERTFLDDGDVVTIRATATGPDGTRIGFGEVTGEILPAPPTRS